MGGGNVAMDAVRTARRLGAAEATLVYRRSRDEMPGAHRGGPPREEEGVVFKYLTDPTEVLADENGWVTGLRCVAMELGEPDASGRRRPVADRRAPSSRSTATSSSSRSARGPTRC